MAGFGDGLGGLIGGIFGHNDAAKAQDAINQRTAAALASNTSTRLDFNAWTQPYNSFGQSFLDPAKAASGDVQDKAKSTLGYDQFMAGYTNTPAAEYQLQQADAMQNNSAASRGGALSGSNLRALTGINQGIIAQNANTAYNEYLQGNNQQFGQLETALGNMFQAIGIGETATGQIGSVASASMGANASLTNANVAGTANIAATQQKNDAAKGSGLGSMFQGLGGMPFKF